jgi:hypothetical protein
MSYDLGVSLSESIERIVLALKGVPACKHCGRPMNTVYVFVTNEDVKTRELLIINWDGNSYSLLGKESIPFLSGRTGIRIYHGCIGVIDQESILPFIKHLLDT